MKAQKGLVPMVVVMIVLAVVLVFAVLVMVIRELMIAAPTITNDFSSNPKGSELLANMKAAGLDSLSEEGTLQHTHQHLDLIINGESIAIPANIGIDSDFISPIHTHDEPNILHVESPKVKDFTLGQFFTEWGITFNEQCVGNYCAGMGSKIFVAINGDPVDNPVSYVLKERDEIEIWYGPIDQTPIVIRSYEFPTGL